MERVTHKSIENNICNECGRAKCSIIALQCNRPVFWCGPVCASAGGAWDWLKDGAETELRMKAAE